MGWYSLMNSLFAGLKRLSSRLHILLFAIIVALVIFNGLYPEWFKENLKELNLLAVQENIVLISLIIFLSYLLFNYILGSFVIREIKEESKESKQLMNIQNKLYELEVELKVQGRDIKEIRAMKFDTEESNENG